MVIYHSQMRIFCNLAVGITLLAGAAAAQPVIGSGGILNAASYSLSGLPNAGIAQGSMFLVFGSGLGPAALSQVSAFPLPNKLAETSIKVTVNSITLDVPMVYTLASQICGILPSSIPTGTGTLTDVVSFGSCPAIARIRIDVSRTVRANGPA